MATQVYKKIKESHNSGSLLDHGVSCGKNPHTMEILQSRKHVGTCNTDVAFHSHGQNGELCIIHNDPMHAGLNLTIKKIQEAHEHNMKSRAANRMPEDGMQLPWVLFNP